MAPKRRSLLLLSDKISAHLKRMEADLDINVPINPSYSEDLRLFYMSGAYVAGSRVGVVYVTYQGARNLTRDQAEEYLDWLDAGNNGRYKEGCK